MEAIIGKLFYHGVAPSEIKTMNWPEMKYWNQWLDLISKAKAKATRNE